MYLLDVPFAQLQRSLGAKELDKNKINDLITLNCVNLEGK